MKKHRYSTSLVNKVLELAEAGMPKTQIGKETKVSQYLISRWLSQKNSKAPTARPPVRGSRVTRPSFLTTLVKSPGLSDSQRIRLIETYLGF